MNDEETIKRFIFMRSQGWSFNNIASQLNVSKPTLIKWSRRHQFEINNLRATETEALAERVFGAKHKRWESLARQLQKIEAEIEGRDLEEIPASRLHGIAAQLRAEIAREMGLVQFSQSSKEIPGAEYVIEEQKWKA